MLPEVFGTGVFSDSSVQGIEECVMDAIIEHNKLATNVDT